MTRTLLTAIFLTLFSQTAWANSDSTICNWLSSKLSDRVSGYDYAENIARSGYQQVVKAKTNDEQKSANATMDGAHELKMKELTEMDILSNIYANLCK